MKKIRIYKLVSVMVALLTSAISVAEIDVTDPADNIEAWVKLDGDTSGKEVYRFGRLVAFGLPGDKFSEALFEMISIRKVAYRSLGNGDYESQQWACGLYADAQTHEFIDELVNPYTDETITLKPYCSNISGSTYSVEKGIGSKANFPMTSTVYNKPYLLDWNITGDIAVVSRPASTQWTEKSSGRTKIETSLDTYTASYADLSNPKLTHVNAVYQYTLATEWMTMLNMRGHPGSMLWVGNTTKHSELDDIPERVRKAFTQRLGKGVLEKPLTWQDHDQEK